MEKASIGLRPFGMTVKTSMISPVELLIWNILSLPIFHSYTATLGSWLTFRVCGADDPKPGSKPDSIPGICGFGGAKARHAVIDER